MKNIFLALFLLLSSWAHANESYDYFKQFLYQVEVDSTDPESPITSTRYVMSQWDKKIPLESGDKLNPSFSLFLLPEDKFVVYYRENIFPKGSDTTFYPRGCKKVEGTWSVPADRLILPGVGYAEKAIVQGKNGMSLVLTEKIISQEAVGAQTNAELGFSNQTIDQQFCF